MTNDFYIQHLHCRTITDGGGSRSADILFPNADPPALERALAEHKLVPDDIPSYFNPLLIKRGHENILIDTGLGGPGDDSARGQLLPSLQALGIAPAEINMVIITHAHPDHIGGALDDNGQATYPNAQYVISRPEWEYWTSSDMMQTERGRFIGQRLLVLEHQYRLVEPDDEITENIRGIPAPGHTPGHMALLIADRLLHVADAIIHPMHCAYPDWSPTFDHDPVQAAATRRDLLRRAVTDNLLLFAYHFPPPAVGRIGSVADFWRWRPTTTP